MGMRAELKIQINVNTFTMIAKELNLPVPMYDGGGCCILTPAAVKTWQDANDILDKNLHKLSIHEFLCFQLVHQSIQDHQMKSNWWQNPDYDMHAEKNMPSIVFC